MRGDLALEARLALRPRGVLGIAAALAGLAGLVAVYLPWFRIRFDVEMLGAHRVGSIARIAGWEAQPWVWVVGALGVVAAVIGFATALDRRPPGAGVLLVLIAVFQALLTGLTALLAPPAERLLSEEQIQRLTNLPGIVPDDVGVRFSVDTTTGIWVALAAAILLLLAAVALREWGG